jgi:hypothetical protein
VVVEVRVGANVDHLVGAHRIVVIAVLGVQIVILLKSQ